MNTVLTLINHAKDDLDTFIPLTVHAFTRRERTH